MERLVSGLRRMAAHRLERTAIPILELCARAETLLRDALFGRQLEFHVDASVVVRCDLDKVIQVLVNLMSNALEAAGSEGRVGVTWNFAEGGEGLVVWDNGPGFAETQPGYSRHGLRPSRGPGSRLAIAHRSVRAHGGSNHRAAA